MKFKVLSIGSKSNNTQKFFIREEVTKGNLVLDIGDPVFFKDRLRAQVIADMLNQEFGRKR